MRFALMTEPQQGYSYQDILDTALTAERLGFETFFRSDHYSSFPGAQRPRHHRRLDDAGRPGPRHEAHRSRLHGLARDLPHPRLLRQGRGHGRRDERRPRRDGRGRRLERGRARGPRHPVPGHGRAGRPDGGGAGHPARALGRARRLVVRGRALPGARHRSSGRRAAAPTSSSAASAGRAPSVSRPAMPTSTTSAPRTRTRCARSWPGSMPPARPSGATPPPSRDRSWRACSSVGTRRRCASGRPPRWPSSGAPRREAEAWLDERRDRWILGTPDEARDRLGEYARHGIDRLLFQDFLPRDLEHIELMAEVAGL